MAIFEQPNLPHEYSFWFKLFQISNHHTHHHHHKQVLIQCLPCGGHHILIHIYFIEKVIGYSSPVGVSCSWEFFRFFSRKNSFKASFTFHSILFFCLTSLQSNSLNVTSKDLESKVRISEIGRDHGSFTGTRFPNRFLVALQLKIYC